VIGGGRAIPEDSLGERVEVCGVPLIPWTQQELVAHVGRCAENGARTTMLPMYAHCINVAQRDEHFRTLLNDPSTIAYADGMAVVWASRLGSAGVPERCTTTDLFPLLMEQAALRNHRVYFLGAAPGVAAQCARRMMDRFPGLAVVGTQDGFFDSKCDDVIIQRINEMQPDIVFVGMGMPYQEKWVVVHRDRLQARAVLTCGATFDFHSGNVRRAPHWMRRSGLEWLHRLVLEPRRLWRRYLIGNWVFMGYVVRDRVSRRRGRDRSAGAHAARARGAR